MVSLTFLGAARGVTGSQYLVRTGQAQFLVDCGLFQGTFEEEQQNYKPLPYNPAEIDFVLLTHAHVDHCAGLPRIVSQGYNNPVYATAATHDLCEIILPDSAHIQEEDFDDCRHQHQNQDEECELLYSEEDARKALRLFRNVNYGERITVGKGIQVRFQDAGHILGSSSIEVTINRDGDKPLTILFSGDIGKKNAPIIRDPTPAGDADYVLMESTYGGQTHQPGQDQMLAEAVNETRERGGNLIIPAFSVQRTQEIIYVLNQLLDEGKIKKQPLFLDSPMGIRVTDVYKEHRECWDTEMRTLVDEGEKPLEFPSMVASMTRDQSKSINDEERSIIISSNGMLTGGRVLYHVQHNIEDPNSSIVFVGYQGDNTLGYILEHGAQHVEINGNNYDVRAHLYDIRGFSAHADNAGLLDWLRPSHPRKVFLVHGELESMQALGANIQQELHLDVELPEMGQTIELG